MIKNAKISSISDKDLYKLCKQYGYMTLEARRKFMGLLPEVYKRKLFVKKGYSSIYEFASRLAGLSNAQVDLTLRLEKKFEDKPVLKKALIEGEISVNKLSGITSIATKENEKELFERTRKLSNRAVEVFVRDVKMIKGNSDGKNEINKSIFDDGEMKINKSIFDNENQNDETGTKELKFKNDKNAKNENQNGLRKGQNDTKSVHVHRLNNDRNIKSRPKSVHVHRFANNILKLDSDVHDELRKLQEKGIDINDLLRETLKKREEEIQREKDEIGEKIADEISQNNKQIKEKTVAKKARKTAIYQKTNEANKPSRYIKAKIKKILKKEYGTKCSIPNCTKKASAIHHTLRFALNPTHDPRFLAPLCKEHHEIAHKIDRQFLKHTCNSP